MKQDEPVSDLLWQSLGKRLSTPLSFVDYTELGLSTMALVLLSIKAVEEVILSLRFSPFHFSRSLKHDACLNY